MLHTIQKMDLSILEFISKNMHQAVLNKIMIGITSLGNMGIIWFIIAILLILNKKYRKVGFLVLCSLFLGVVFGNGILKHAVRRMRPFYYDKNLDVLVKKPSSYSFPSGHATASFAAACVLAKYLRKYAAVFLTLAFLIAFSRLYVCVHNPTDVIVGALLGFICAKFTIKLEKVLN